MAVTVVAELGINHGGNPDTAVKLIDAAADAGCDGVKVQSYRTEDFLPEGHPDYAMFEQAEIWPWLDRLCAHAHKRKLIFGTTPTSVEGVQEAVEAGVDYLKNGSDFLLRRDLINAMIATGLPTWVSCGMATLKEIRAVPGSAKLMLCTSLYPCPDEEANLERLYDPDLEGFSDHTAGTVAAIVAAGLGVEMIEKHFTLSKTQEGPDHGFSADPGEMAALVRDVRRVERLLGSPELHPTPGEMANRERWRVTAEQLRAA